MSLKDHNNYKPGYEPSQVSHHEWRTAENSAAFLLPHLQAQVRRNPKVKLLDVGAGSGTITTSLAKYMPEGKITATDISEDILARAEHFATSTGAKNISFQQANVYELPFPSNSFDVSHASQVLTHLDHPVEALREMVRVTKPGGVVAIRDSDLKSIVHWPVMEEIDKSNALVSNAMQQSGGTGMGGRQVLSWALKAGVPRENITMTFGTWTYSTVSDRKVWANATIERFRNGEIRKRSIETGLATEAEIDWIIQGWERWIECEDGSLGVMQGEILIQVE